MNHPPETSLTSRKLAKRLLDEVASVAEDGLGLHAASAIIDAWVRVREAVARLLSAQKYGICCCDVKEGYSCFLHTVTIPELESALATARKQLEEKVK